MAIPSVGLASLVAGEASASVLACFFLLAVTLALGYVSKKHHWIYFPESSCALVLGILFGLAAKAFQPQLAFTFEPEVFFYGLLPIIIFNAGFGLKKRDFFRNFATIMLFAVVGTIISTLAFGLLTYVLYQQKFITHMASESPLLESLMYGSLISAIDPVATLSIFQDVEAPALLYNVVFGESLVNDAACIVLFRTFESFLDEEFGLSSLANAMLRFVLISVGSIALGVLISLIGAFALRLVEVRTDYTKFELSIILISAYISYSVAELLELSGIMALFFCGICNAHYSYYSTTHASKVSSKYAFEALAFMSEMFVFAYLGMQVVVAHQVFDKGLMLSAIPLCLLSRAANIFPLSWVANRARSKKISGKMIFVMWFSGLRGAIAFALSVNLPTRNPAIETTTLFVCVTTTLLLGGSTAPLLRGLDLVSDHSEGEERLDIEFLRRSSAMDKYDESNTELPKFHKSFKWVDKHYLKPLFGGQLDVSSDEALVQSGKIMSKIGELITYKGIGFSLDVPSSWVPLSSSFALVGFASPVLDPLGVPRAEVDVVVFEGGTSGGGVEDPADFLLEHWTRICPELSPPTLDSEEEDNLARSHSHSSFRIPSTRSFSRLRQQPSLAGPSMAPRSNTLSREEVTPVASTSSSESAPLRERQSQPKLNSNAPAVAAAGGRVVPAFVMHCEHSSGDAPDDLFRYEIVSHPEDLGARKATIRHFYISVWKQGIRIFLCRIKASEGFLFEGGIYPVTMILDSFKTEVTSLEYVP